MVRDACAYIEPEGSGSHIKWKRCADVSGVRVFLARLEDSPIVLIKGSVVIRIPEIGKVAEYFVKLDSTAAMRHSLEKLDPMFRDGRVICRLPHRLHGSSRSEGEGGVKAAEAEVEAVRPAPVAGEEPLGKSQVEWAMFAAPPPLAPRDFCWLEHSTYARTPGGHLLFLSLCSSVEREEAPDMWQSHGYVRGKLTSTGYIFKQTAEGSEDWELSYVVQVGSRLPARPPASLRARRSRERLLSLRDLCCTPTPQRLNAPTSPHAAPPRDDATLQIDPKGIIPTWVVNLVATDQASNAAAMRDAVAERMFAEATLRGPRALFDGVRTEGGQTAEAAKAAVDDGWADVPLQEALLARDGGSAVVSLGQIASGRDVEWRWLAGSEAEAEHAHVSCQLEMEAVAFRSLQADLSASFSEATKTERELPTSRVALVEHDGHESDRGTPAAAVKVHVCSARTHASAQHWIKFSRRKTLLERFHWAGIRPLTIFLQVRVR